LEQESDVELLHQRSLWKMTGHVTNGSSHNNLTTQGSVILPLTPVANGRANFNLKILKMEITLPESLDSYFQAAISVELDPPYSEFSPNYQLHLINPVKATLIEEF